MPTTISAKIVADSICPRGNRITSMLLTMPRYLLAEFNTHRMFSRNSASSRAIPFKKMVEAVKKDPFIPYQWMKDHSGMQGTEYLDQDEAYWAKETWIAASEYQIKCATSLNERYKVTKQMCNRLLEPFMWHTVLVTATEFENFFAQRYNSGADMHMQLLAIVMLDAMNNSTPKKKKIDEWHIPFGDDINDDKVIELLPKWYTPDQLANKDKNLWDDFVQPIFIKIATARAARTSYTLPDSVVKDDYEADIKLHDKLWSYPHPSPFEHCAKVPIDQDYAYNDYLFGNFRGWVQYRKLLPNENQKDARLIKHNSL